jgi:hypothetical protein
MAETKPKQSSELRTPKPKKKLGLHVPPALRMPHEDLIPARSENTSMTSHTSLTSPTSVTSHTTEGHPVAPVRDFAKVANSISREAVPAGIFKGKSKQIYDVLYSLTRGAIVPVRKVRISRPKLMAMAHIGARVTFDANIKHLRSVGLIAVTNIAGEHEGNEYEVFIPEESMSSHTSHTSQARYAQKVDSLDSLETSQTRHTSSSENSTTSGASKTSFKTNTERSDDDDAALADLYAALKQASKEITGRDLSTTERSRWKELAELLVTEAKIAAARTTVSSLPAFLTEHLRRRLWKKEKTQLDAEQRTEPQSIGAQTLTEEQIKSCPDCGGSTWYYPEGTEKGIKRCRHEKLLEGSQSVETPQA